MTYSYTQISQYLTCPRRYRYRYLDGWKEKDNRAAMLFGRAFEQALGLLLSPGRPWGRDVSRRSAAKSQPLHFSHNDTWDRMFEQGIMLLDPLLSGQSCPHPPTASQSADQSGQSRFPAAIISCPMLTPSAS